MSQMIELLYILNLWEEDKLSTIDTAAILSPVQPFFDVLLYMFGMQHTVHYYRISLTFTNLWLPQPRWGGDIIGEGGGALYLFQLCTSASKQWAVLSLYVATLPFRSLLQVSTSARFFTSEAVNTSEPQPLPPPPPDGVSKSYPEKIQSLVRDISKLTLLETAQLNELLKVSLVRVHEKAYWHCMIDQFHCCTLSWWYITAGFTAGFNSPATVYVDVQCLQACGCLC